MLPPERYTSGPYDVPSEKSRMPDWPLRAALTGKLIWMPGRKSEVQTAKTLIPNGVMTGPVVVVPACVVVVVPPPPVVVVVASVVVVCDGAVVVVW
jgi:hypothetical protein